MSWDVLLLRLPDDVTSVQRPVQDHASAPLGSRSDVLTAARRALPEADLSEPEGGILEGPGWSIEFNIGREDPVESMLLYVRGTGDDVLDPIFRLAAALSCRVLDAGKDELITEGDTSGWHSFQAFRDIFVQCLVRSRDAKT